jgi:hypothetical protein
VSKPLWCTESTCHLHLFIAPLVAALLTKSAPIEKISSIFEPPTTSALNYNQNFLKDEFQTSLMHWIALSSPFVHISFGCCTTMKVGSDFWRSRVFLSTHTTTALNYSQNFFQGGVQTSLMRWIRLSSPFVHSTSGCGATMKVGVDFRRFRVFSSTPPPPPRTTIRTCRKVYSGPFWCAESGYRLNLSVAPLGSRDNSDKGSVDGVKGWQTMGNWRIQGEERASVLANEGSMEVLPSFGTWEDGTNDVGHCFRLRLRMRVGGLHDIQG